MTVKGAYGSIDMVGLFFGFAMKSGPFVIFQNCPVLG